MISRLSGSDATISATADGRLHWLFAVIDHYSGGWPEYE